MEKLEINVVGMEYKHVVKVIELVDEAFGKGYLTHGKCKRYIDMGSVYKNRLSLVAVSSQGDVIGCLMAFPLYCVEGVVVLKLIVVDREYRRCGVGKALMEEFLKKGVIENGFKRIIAIVWAESPYNAYGFVSKYVENVALKIPYAWYLSSLEEDWECVRCGVGCNCTAIIMETYVDSISRKLE